MRLDLLISTSATGRSVSPRRLEVLLEALPAFQELLATADEEWTNRTHAQWWSEKNM